MKLFLETNTSSATTDVVSSKSVRRNSMLARSVLQSVGTEGFLKHHQHNFWKTGTCLLLASMLLVELFNFQNVMDLKNLAHNHCGKVCSAPFYLYTFLYGGPKNEYLEVSCNEVTDKLLFSTNQPILIKGCVQEPKNRNVLKDLAPAWEESVANLYPPCDDINKHSNFTYTNKHGILQNIVEKVPCDQRTLAEKIEWHSAHDYKKLGSDFTVHLMHLRGKDKHKMSRVMGENGYLPTSFQLSDFRTWVSIFFLTSGRTAVDYFHSHMDHAFSFGLGLPKKWELINPIYTDNFEHTWTGQAILLTKEKEVETPRVFITQDPGDILVLPPWWLHKTSQNPSTKVEDLPLKQATVSLHTLTRRSVVGGAVHVFMDILGDSQFFGAKNNL